MLIPAQITSMKMWEIEFNLVIKFLEGHEPHGVIRISEGEIVDATVINIELTRTEAEFNMLGPVKLRAICLVDYATRNYDIERGKWKEVVLGMRDKYPAEKDREDFVNAKTSADKNMLDAAKKIRTAVKDERSRLLQYVKTLQTIGANTREEWNMERSIQGARNKNQRPF